MKITTAAEIRKIEEVENEIGTGFLRLMELAGTGCARQISAITAPSAGPIAVVCGNGKNGGDGFVIARRLLEAGYDVTAVLAFGPPKAEDAVLNYERALDAEVPVVSFEDQPEEAKAVINKAALLVDCMFGIGFRGAANEAQAEVFLSLNNAPGTVVAVDVPSGVVTDTGEVLGAAVKADRTIAITTLKPLHVLYPAREYCGRIEFLDIGILEESLNSVPESFFTFSADEAAAALPSRPRTAHKNDFGHVLALCGSYRMPGAACLCVKAALRGGAGLVTAAYPEPAYPALASHLTEAMHLPVKATPKGELSTASIPDLKEALKKATVLVAGPGLGQNEEIPTVLSELLEAAEVGRVPVVLDADALNAIAARPRLLQNFRGTAVITPHPGEFARLSGKTAGEIAENRAAAAKEFADRYGVTVLLKGADTVVASPDREAVYINTTGNQGLAKGGSGDTLAGLLAALLSQGASPMDAACLAAYYHGKAAEFCGADTSLRSILATDVLEAFGKVLP